MAHRLHSSASLRLVSTKASSSFRNKKPSSKTIAQLPSAARASRISGVKLATTPLEARLKNVVFSLSQVMISAESH